MRVRASEAQMVAVFTARGSAITAAWKWCPTPTPGLAQQHRQCRQRRQRRRPRPDRALAAAAPAAAPALPSPDRLAGRWRAHNAVAVTSCLANHAATCLAFSTAPHARDCAFKQAGLLHVHPMARAMQAGRNTGLHLVFARPEPGRNRAAQVAGSRPPLPLSSGVSTRVTGAPAAAVQAGACGP